MSPQPLKRQPFVLFFLLASLIWALLAWFSTHLYASWQAEQALETIETRAQEGIHDLENGLGKTILLLQYVTDLLSRYENIREAVDRENRHPAISQLPEEQRRVYYEKQPRLSQINDELVRAAKDADVISNIWIMKKDGITIASGNASGHDSFVGTRFDYRSYFIDGISGKKGHQYAFGIRSRVPGLFFASPIRQDNLTIGVVASKVNLSYLYNWVSQTNGILIDKYGVIIQAANHQFEMMSLPDATVHMLSEKRRMDRYNRTEFPVLSIAPWEGASKVQLMQLGDLPSPFYVMTAQIMGDELTLMTAIDASSLLTRTEHWLFLVILIGGGILFFLVLTIVAYQFQILQRIRQRRAMAKQLIDREISRADTTGKKFAVMYIDMDAFKEVNNTFGYETGDDILQAINERIQQVIRKTDTIIRRTEDTFITLLNDINLPSDVENIAVKIQEAIHAPLDISGVILRLTASIGIAIYPTDGQTASQILRHADTALYSVKEQGRAEYAFYHTQMSVDLAARNKLDADMEKGLAAQEFFLVYQPQLSLKTGQLIGCEALIRWQHPTRGIIPPVEFIPVAERTGFINSLGPWILNEACRQTRAWNDELGTGIRVAVNISPRQFQRRDLLNSIKVALKKNDLPPCQLELEMTETLMMTDTERVLLIIQELQELGMQISIDDFGTGYSSLAYLRKFDANVLKIDRAFVNDMVTNVNDHAIISAIINMANSLEYQVIAEGVETTEQYALLKELGCHAIQGYWFSKPLSPDDFIRFYSQHTQSLDKQATGW